MEYERIESLSKEKELFLKDNYEEQGISASLLDVKFSVNPTDGADKQFSKFKSAIKRAKKATFLGSSLEEKLQFIQDISFGPYQVHVEPLTWDIDVFSRYLCELLWDCARFYKDPNHKKNVEENPHSLVEKTQPVKVEVQWGDKKYVGYSLLLQEIPPGSHFKRWKLRGRRFAHEYIFDMSSLMADILAKNMLVQFTKSNKDLVQYKIAQAFSDMQKRERLNLLPIDEAFAKDLQDVMKRFDLPCESGEPITNAAITISPEDFYLTEDEFGDIPRLRRGYLRNIMTIEMVSTIAYIQDKTERLFQQKSDYARSFQMKKNIPKKVQAIMENNVFLQKYGLVELDESVDLEKFAALEKEFLEIMEKVYIPEAKDHSFRVKRLGHHHCAGMYYASFNSTIFDINAPWAYFHELGHQLDFSLARKEGIRLLSEAIRFKPVLDLYKKKVHALVQQDPAFLAVWSGRTKFNGSYYLQNTEVFARSYEIYLYFMKGIRTSFLDKEYNSPVYPKDEEFINVVKSYFDHVFDLLGWMDDKKPKKEEPMTRVEEFIPQDQPQLTDVTIIAALRNEYPQPVQGPRKHYDDWSAETFVEVDGISLRCRFYPEINHSQGINGTLNRPAVWRFDYRSDGRYIPLIHIKKEDGKVIQRERTILHSLVEKKNIVSVYSSHSSEMALSYICETASDQLSFNF